MRCDVRKKKKLASEIRGKKGAGIKGSFAIVFINNKQYWTVIMYFIGRSDTSTESLRIKVLV